MKDSRRFADLLNAEWYQGKSVVLPENIHEKTDGTFRIHKASDKIHTAKIAGDVVKEITVKGKPLWVILEIQSDTHFAMPVRIFNEEGMQYQEQWRRIRKQHREKRDLKGAEYVSGFGKSDRLIPVVTIVLHLGSDPWMGPSCLQEMMDLSHYPEHVRKGIGGASLYLVDVRRYPHPELFQTDLGCVFGFLKYSGEKDKLRNFIDSHPKEFSHLPEDAYDFISVMAGDRELAEMKAKNKNAKGDYNMCQAIRDMIQEGYQNGHAAGQRSGIHLMKQIYRLQTSGKDRREIARICGLSERQLDDILKEEP